MGFVKKGYTSEQSSQLVMKTHPMYTAEKPNEDHPVEDKKLPIELKNRINTYYENLLHSGDIQNHKLELEKYSSCNAFLREELNLCKKD